MISTYTKESYLVRRYAQAYLNLFIDEIQRKHLERFQLLAQFLDNYHDRLFFIHALPIPSERIYRLVKEWIAQFHDIPHIDDLIRVLVENKRVHLMPEILRAIIRLYQERTATMMFTVSSSHELTVEEQEVIRAFLARVTGYAIMYEYAVDKKLIAGLKMHSETLLWEYSVAKQLRALERAHIY